MLQIYDDQHRRIAGIDDPDDLKIEKTLSSGDKQISFSYPKTGSEIENLRAEYYIRTKDDEYVLKEINTGENKNSYVAQLNIEELESQEFLYGFESVTQTARACLEFAFDGTDSSGRLDQSRIRWTKKRPERQGSIQAILYRKAGMKR